LITNFRESNYNFRLQFIITTESALIRAHTSHDAQKLKIKNLIQDPRGGLAVKCKKIPYLTIFNKLKHFTMPTFWVILKTLNTPLLG